jgi:hypothetical protein
MFGTFVIPNGDTAVVVFVAQMMKDVIVNLLNYIGELIGYSKLDNSLLLDPTMDYDPILFYNFPFFQNFLQ